MAYLHFDSFLNLQICGTWGLEKPQVIAKRQMHPQRLIV